MRHHGLPWQTLLFAAMTFVSACTGQIAGDAATGSPSAPTTMTGGEPATGPGGAGAPTTPGAPGSTPGAPASPGANTAPPAPPPSFPDACGAAIDPGYVGLRRLTRVEYDNTVRDLLGDTSLAAAANFPTDDSVIAEQALVSTLFFEKLQAVVQKQIDDAWARDVTANRPASAKLIVCPIKPGDTACSRTIISTFARKAWRRPLSPAELEPFFALVTTAEGKGDDNAIGVKLALRALMLSPDFVYRVETDTAVAPRALTAHELAVRLSYLLWSTMPDARLSELADNGTLTQAPVLLAEITRMLADPKAKAFTEGFVNHWLMLDRLEGMRPDPMTFNGWDDALRQAMTAETRQLFQAFLDEGRAITSLLDADFTFVNSRLAQHYGITAPAGAGTDVRKVMLAAGPRRGLLGQGSLLSLTSSPNKTSAVKRGKFVLTQLLCSKPPPPPDGAAMLTQAASMGRTERERLEVHRANPQCAGCHALFDPIGLGLENFDLVGRYRTKYPDGLAIDPSGELVGGGAFKTVDELKALLKTDARFGNCVSEQLFAYAVGRVPGAGDTCAQAAVNKQFATAGRLKDLITALTASPAFTQRRAEPAGGMP